MGLYVYTLGWSQKQVIDGQRTSERVRRRASYHVVDDPHTSKYLSRAKGNRKTDSWHAVNDEIYLRIVYPENTTFKSWKSITAEGVIVSITIYLRFTHGSLIMVPDVDISFDALHLYASYPT